MFRLVQCLFWVFLLGSLACTAAKIPELQVESPATYPLHTEFNGLKLAVDPYLDPARVEGFFSVDLLAEGIVPILLVIENSSEAQGYRILRDNVALLQAEGTLATQSEVTGSQQLNQQLGQAETLGGAWAGAATPLPLGYAYNLGPGAAFAAIGAYAVFTEFSATRKKDVLEYSILETQLMDKTLYPGQTLSGFVYFRLDDSDIGSITGIRVLAEGLKNIEDIAFEFTLTK